MKLTPQIPASLRETLDKFFQPRNERRTSVGEDAVGLLVGEEKDALNSPTSTRASLLHKRSKRTYAAIALGVLLLLLAAVVLPGRAKSSTELGPQENYTKKNHYFHLALPTTASTIELCKTVLSGATLDWPTPWVISWQADEHVPIPKWNESFARIEAVSLWLNDLPQQRNRDTIAILGNTHAWFQVRPEVFLSRYIANKERANRRLEETLSPETILEKHMKAKVIFSSEKTCPSDRECLGFEAEDQSIHFLSSNVVVGELKDMRPLWRNALKHAVEHANLNETFDESTIFAHLLRDQEKHRDEVSKLQGVTERTAIPNEKKQNVKDFGIALDFSRELSYAADATLEGVDWIRHDKKAGKKLSLPNDIAATRPPFWTLTSAGVPRDTTWSDVPLLTGIGANIVPSILQLGPDAKKELATTWWKNLWFNPHARKLLDSFALTPIVPIAFLPEKDGESRYWSAHWEKVGIKTNGLEFHKWKILCGDESWSEELFGDKLGAWKDPRP